MNRLLRTVGLASGAVALTLAAGGFTPRPASGADEQILPGQPMIPLSAAGSPLRAASLSRDRKALPVTRSVNWSGYTVTRGGQAFRLVRATFFVPYLDCAVSPRAYSADWAGLDGFYGKKPDSVEQAGIEADCGGHAGKTASYRAWYEMFPQPESVRPIKVRPGDSVTASVSYVPASRRFRLAVTDNTNRHRFAVSKACAAASCPRNSAQAISEAPAGGQDKLLHLADYGAVSFTAMRVTDAAGHPGSLLSRHWRATEIVQYGDSSKKRIAQPTAIHGAGFANYWLGGN